MEQMHLNEVKNMLPFLKPKKAGGIVIATMSPEGK